MIATREAVMSALFTLLQSATFAQPVNDNTTWATTSRRLKLWSDVPKSQRPALFMIEPTETPSYADIIDLPPKFSMSVELFVYIDSSDMSTIPATDLNVIMDAIIAVLAPNAGAQTLGGLVKYCRINGRVIKASGDLDGDGLMVIPLTILCP